MRPSLTCKLSASFAGPQIIHGAGEATVSVAITWLLDEDTQSFAARVWSHRGFPQAYLQLLKIILQVCTSSTLAECVKVSP